MSFSCSLRDSWTDVLDISFNCDSFELRIVVLNNPIQSYVIAIVLLNHIVSHLFYLEQICVVEIHEMATDECQTNQTNIEYIFCFAFSVLKALFQGVLVVSGAIRYNWCYRAYGIFLPYLKTTFELLAINCDIVID